MGKHSTRKTLNNKGEYWYSRDGLSLRRPRSELTNLNRWVCLVYRRTKYRRLWDFLSKIDLSYTEPENYGFSIENRSTVEKRLR